MVDPASGPSRAFRFGIVAPFLSDLPTWCDQVRRIAGHGYSTVLMPDFPKLQPAPAPALAVAATVADVRVGTWVYAAPLRAPWLTAWEAHSRFIGDGETDIPCMRLVRDQGGHSIAVYQPGSSKKKARAEKLITDKRADFIAPADYSAGGRLDEIMRAIIEKIAANNEVRRMMRE